VKWILILDPVTRRDDYQFLNELIQCLIGSALNLNMEIPPQKLRVFLFQIFDVLKLNFQANDPFKGHKNLIIAIESVFHF